MGDVYTTLSERQQPFHAGVRGPRVYRHTPEHTTASRPKQQPFSGYTVHSSCAHVRDRSHQHRPIHPAPQKESSIINYFSIEKRSSWSEGEEPCEKTKRKRTHQETEERVIDWGFLPINKKDRLYFFPI